MSRPPAERETIEQPTSRPAAERRPGWLERLLGWLDDRLGIQSTILPIITHPVPAGLDWSYVLGSAVLVAFVLQVLTGVALSFSYVPSTDAAYESLQFITHEALLGRFIRGAHFWGASAMVTLVFAHLAQVFLVGAYKFPRELNWVTGSLLLLLTLGLAFTGQLLRWEQNAVWSIVVAAEQAGKTPIVGNLLMQLLLAGWSVGPATLSRFYATHVFLLPAGVFLLAAVHLYLVYRIGISDPPVPGQRVDPRTERERYARVLETRGEPFFPEALFRDIVGAAVVTLAVFGLAAIVGPPELGHPPDPTVVQAYPRPDWYFLWYFALLASIPAVTETIAILGIPALVGVVLLLLPFIANRGERAPSRRPWAVGAVVLVFVGFLALTVHGIRTPWSPVLGPVVEAPLPPAALDGLSERERVGADVYRTHGCQACHALFGVGGSVGPDLSAVGSRYDRATLVQIILAGRGNMPSFATSLDPDRLEALVDFLETLERPGPGA